MTYHACQLDSDPRVREQVAGTQKWAAASGNSPDEASHIHNRVKGLTRTRIRGFHEKPQDRAWALELVPRKKLGLPAATAENHANCKLWGQAMPTDRTDLWSSQGFNPYLNQVWGFKRNPARPKAGGVPKRNPQPLTVPARPAAARGPSSCTWLTLNSAGSYLYIQRGYITIQRTKQPPTSQS